MCVCVGGGGGVGREGGRGLTFGGGKKNLMGVYRRGQMIRFLKHMFQKHNQMNIPNLFNG